MRACSLMHFVNDHLPVLHRRVWGRQKARQLPDHTCAVAWKLCEDLQIVALCHHDLPPHAVAAAAASACSPSAASSAWLSHISAASAAAIATLVRERLAAATRCSAVAAPQASSVPGQPTVERKTKQNARVVLDVAPAAGRCAESAVWPCIEELKAIRDKSSVHSRE